jgi:phospholipid/cholesterol/gamma-HCH transport system permease protein
LAKARIERGDEGKSVILTGEWTTRNIGGLERSIAGVRRFGTPSVAVDVTAVERMDTSGAWMLHQLLSKLEKVGVASELRGMKASYTDLLTLVRDRRGTQAPVAPPPRENPLALLGRQAVGALDDFISLIAFSGEAVVAFVSSLGSPSRIRVRTILKHIETSGVKALPIVGLLTFLLGIVIAYQGGVQLQQYGANIFIVELVTITMIREMSPLIVAIIVAGRTGSAFTAEIGTMKVNEEVDAMQTMGISRMDLLVLPKVQGLTISMPLLTLFGMATGVLGGMVMAYTTLGVGFDEFLARVPETVDLSHFLVGIGKVPVFAIIIAMVGCYQGFRVTGGAESVGEQTTISVVRGIFLVIVADAAFSIVFSWLGI